MNGDIWHAERFVSFLEVESMKWIDYREKLGIGFSNEDKVELLKNKIRIKLSALNDGIEAYPDDFLQHNDASFRSYFLVVGEIPKWERYNLSAVIESIQKEHSIAGVISKHIALINVASAYLKGDFIIDAIKNGFLETLDSVNIHYSIMEDEDGMFIFQKGIPEFDDALVSEPLEWLRRFPNAERAWGKALRDYSETKENNASVVADNFRKALESFFQEFFGGSKSLENYKNEYGAYLKKCDIPKEISGNFEALLQSYTNYINSYAKHRDATSNRVLEYLLYQTGNIMRLLMTLKDEET